MLRPVSVYCFQQKRVFLESTFPAARNTALQPVGVRPELLKARARPFYQTYVHQFPGGYIPIPGIYPPGN
jgi:hypothetical protein